MSCYWQPEEATIVAIEKESTMWNVRSMEVTAEIKRTGQIVKFPWISAPGVVTDRSHTNKAPEEFEKFWEAEDLTGREVLLYHATEFSYSYMRFEK